MQPPALIVRVMGRVQAAVYRASGGRIGSRFGKASILILTTTGRRSGRTRSAPLIYVEDTGAYWIVGSFGGRDEHPAWVHNLRADPTAHVTIRDKTIPVRAHAASPADRERVWPTLLSVYPAYSSYEGRTGRRFEVFALEPDDDATV